MTTTTTPDCCCCGCCPDAVYANSGTIVVSATADACTGLPAGSGVCLPTGTTTLVPVPGQPYLAGSTTCTYTITTGSYAGDVKTITVVFLLERETGYPGCNYFFLTVTTTCQVYLGSESYVFCCVASQDPGYTTQTIKLCPSDCTVDFTTTIDLDIYADNGLCECTLSLDLTVPLA
jgi:hypothetical protein